MVAALNSMPNQVAMPSPATEAKVTVTTPAKARPMHECAAGRHRSVRSCVTIAYTSCKGVD